MTTELFSLADQVIVVTGSTRGLGRAMAEGLAAAGAHVIINGRQQAAAEACADGFRNRGLRATAMGFDIRDAEAVRGAVSAVMERHGRLDGLISNAGLAFRKPTLAMTLDDWREVISTDLDAGFVLAQAAAGPMVERGRGSIVFVASILGLISRPEVAAYSAAKAGLIGLMQSLSIEYGSLGIRCNAIAPGYFLTDAARPLHDNAEFNQLVCRRTPLGRWGQPDELAGIAIFLMSPAASYVTGATFTIDGGLVSSL